MMKLKQRGGTFLGLIIGATIGLAVALAVAIYVANVPIPFVNKNATRTNGQDAAEAEKNKAWDPNAGLRSHNGALPAASTATMGTVAPQPQPVPIAPPPEAHPQTPTRTTAVPPPAEVKPTESRTASKPAERASAAVASKPAASSPTRAQSSDPLGDFAAARAGMSKPAATAPAGETSGLTYFVQAGAFRSSDDAEAQRARLSLLGVQARVSEREQVGRTVYRVRVGPFQNKDAAARVVERLNGEGLESALVSAPR